MSIRNRLVEYGYYVASPIALLVTSPILAQGLGPADRGELGVVQSVVAIGAALGVVGQAEVFLAQRRDGGGDIRRSSLIVWIGSLIAAIVAAWFLVHIGNSLWIALIVLVSVPLLSQQRMWQAVSIAHQRLRGPALTSAIGALVRIVLVFALFWIGWMSLEAAFAAVQFAAAAGAILALGLFAWRNSKLMTSRFKVPSFLALIVSGAPLIVFNIFTSITFHGGILLMKWMVDPTSLGVFAACAALSKGALSVSGVFKVRVQAALLLEHPQQQFNREVLIAVTISTGGAFVVSGMSTLLVDILLGSGYESAVPVLRILAFASAALVLLDIMHGSLAVIGRHWGLVLVSAVGAASSLLGLVLLVPNWGIEGAAMAVFIAYSVAALLGWYLIRAVLRRSSVACDTN